MSLTTAVSRVLAIGRQCTGVKIASSPPDSLDVLPAVVAWPQSGSLSGMDATFSRGIHNIRCEMHVARDVLPTAIATLTGWAEQFPHLLAGDPTLDGAISTVVFPVTYDLLFVEWGGTPTLALAWTVPVKILGAPVAPTT